LGQLSVEVSRNAANKIFDIQDTNDAICFAPFVVPCCIVLPGRFLNHNIRQISGLPTGG
jgi:hypothetical protein